MGRQSSAFALFLVFLFLMVFKSQLGATQPTFGVPFAIQNKHFRTTRLNRLKKLRAEMRRRFVAAWPALWSAENSFLRAHYFGARPGKLGQATPGLGSVADKPWLFVWVVVEGSDLPLYGCGLLGWIQAKTTEAFSLQCMNFSSFSNKLLSGV